ncbi:glutamyl aminopeptidase isoform X2 [Folsomia candida]|uniref:glutamyl aminopeptidase isoform X2 n=1 Tax=Folsomia candida TaxID=158441 RepID=UPI001604FEC9|nr:glutamyl aminopeptidase isoform X2 [Folsomia candida]
MGLKPCTSLVLGVMGVAVLLALGCLGYFGIVRTSGESYTPTGCTIPEEKCEIRLSPKVHPSHYEIYLFPSFEYGNFTGNVSISLTLLDTMDHIRLHVKYLDVSETKLTFTTNQTTFSVTTYEYPLLDYWVIKPNSEGVTFPRGEYELSMSFGGSLTRDITGLYRSSYSDPRDNKTKYVVSSKFQPTAARRAFPCFDEPSIKSTFSVTLVKPYNFTAISNMPIATEQSDTPSAGLTTVRFAKSVPMVTYLVAFTVGDLAFIERRSKRGVPVRIYTTPFQIKSGEYASSITADILDFFEDYFGIPYPLPKLDVVGIPDFVSGAMEHWGMVSFRESNLLYQPGVGSAANKQRVATVIGHELAHMWFGNLMTLKWWSDLWLNEGFASYMEYKGVAVVHPEWEIEAQFVAEDLIPILSVDGQISSHPIVQDVKHPNQITELFDRISYSKGASVIRMLENFMGLSRFRKGVSNFLQKYSYANAETMDLWSYLQKEVDRSNPANISLVMDTWTGQMGYPVLILNKSEDGRAWMVSQQRFLDNRDAVQQGTHSESPFHYRWEIPIELEWTINSKSTEKMIWMRHDEGSVTLPLDASLPWVKLNRGQFGYFRVLYPPPSYQTLKETLLANFDPRERCGAVDDAFSLSYAYYLEYKFTLDFSQYLKMENHYIPWSCAREHFFTLGRLIKSIDSDTSSLFQKYILALVSNMYHKLDWSDTESDNHLDRLLKPLIFSLACENGHRPCLERAKELFSRWIADPKSPSTQVPSGLRDVVYKWGMYQSDLADWDRLLNIYGNEPDPQESIRQLRALANVQDASILKNFLELSKNETLVRRQDYFHVIKYYSGNPIANPIVWDFYRNQYDYLVNRFSLNDRTFGRAITAISYSYATQDKLKEVD